MVLLIDEKLGHLALFDEISPMGIKGKTPSAVHTAKYHTAKQSMCNIIMLYFYDTAVNFLSYDL